MLAPDAPQRVHGRVLVVVEVLFWEALSYVRSVLPGRWYRRAAVAAVFAMPLLAAIAQRRRIVPSTLPWDGFAMAAGWTAALVMITLSRLLRSNAMRARLIVAPLGTAQRLVVFQGSLMIAGALAAWVVFATTSHFLSREPGEAFVVASIFFVVWLQASLATILVGGFVVKTCRNIHAAKIMCSCIGGIILMLTTTLRMPRDHTVEQVATFLAATAVGLGAGYGLVARSIWASYLESDAGDHSTGRSLLVYIVWGGFLILQAFLFGWSRRRSAGLGMVIAGSFPMWYRMREEYAAERWRIAPGATREALRVLASRGVAVAVGAAVLVALSPARARALPIAGGIIAASACLLHLTAWVRWSAYAVVVGVFTAMLERGTP